MARTLAEILNSPADYVYEGKAYKLREAALDECGQYQRWMEQEARASAARATELPEEDRRNLLRDVQADIAAQRYAWGGEACVNSLRTPNGIAKLLSIVCADQGVTEALARKIVQSHFLDVAQLLLGVLESDPEGKELAPILNRMGLAPNFFHSSSPPSPTPPTGATSGSSAGSASPSSGPSSSTSPATSTGAPS